MDDKKGGHNKFPSKTKSKFVSSRKSSNNNAVASKEIKIRRIKVHSLWHCNVCGIQFRSIEGVLDVGKVVSCAKCESKVCRFRCSKRNARIGWICRLCQQSENWLINIFDSIFVNRHSRNVLDVSNLDSGSGIMAKKYLEEIDEDLELLRKKEKEQVRDFIEKIIDAMIGGNVDNVSVAKVYDGRAYDLMFSKYHADLSNNLTELGSALHISITSKNLPINGKSPSSAHASLKQIIQRIVQEAIDLPQLTKNRTNTTSPEINSDCSYEDLLATAILNKVIQSYQDELPSSSRNSVSSRLSSSSRRSQSNKEYFFGEENLVSKWKNNPLSNDAESSISLEDLAQSGPSSSVTHFDSASESRHRVEEVLSSDDEEEEGPQYIHTDSLLRSNGYSDEWHENWLMQKRKLNGTASPVPVPMLVPNPNTETKVKIGEKEVDETSDLSDVGSDFGDMESTQDIKMLLVDSKTVIGGKNLLDKINLTTEDESNDILTIDEEKEDVVVLPGNNISSSNCVKINNSDAENTYTSLDSNFEKDTEYTERYASLPRTIEMPKCSKLVKEENQHLLQISNNSSLKNGHVMLEENEHLLQISNSSLKNGHVMLEENNNEIETNVPDTKEKNDLMSQNNDITDSKLFKGTYAEREKNKWQKHAVELKNNPYSEENLQRRLSNQSNSSTSSLFGRDYYVKQAARSAGASKAKREKIYDYQLSYSENNPEENEISLDEYSLSDPKSSINDSHDDDQLLCNVNNNKGNQEENLNDSNSSLDLKINGVVTHEMQNSIDVPVETKNIEILSLVSQEETDSIDKNGIASPKPTSLEISSDSDRSLERVYNVGTGKVTMNGKVNDNLEEKINSPKIIKESFKKPIVVDENSNIREGLVRSNSQQILPPNKSVPFELPEPQKMRKKIYSHFLSHSLNRYASMEDILMAGNYENKSIENIARYPTLSKASTSNENKEHFSLDNSTGGESYKSFLSDYSSENIYNSTRILNSSEADLEIDEIRNKHLVKSLLSEFSTPNRANNKEKEQTELICKQNKKVVEENVDNHVIRNGSLENKTDSLILESSINGIDQFDDKIATDFISIQENFENGETKYEQKKKKSELDTLLEHIPSVKYLKKIFDKSSSRAKLHSTSDKSKLVHSLTARSIPVEVRKELKNFTKENLSQNSEQISEESNLIEVVDSLDDTEDLLNFPKAKSKIQFFESLKK